MKMAIINGGKGLVLESSINRKWNILTFFIVVSLLSFSPMLIAGTTYWDIHAGVYFRASSTGGDIDFNEAIVTTQIRMINSLVEFTSLTMGGDHISLIGFSASSNCDMTLLDIEPEKIIYEVTATAGQTSTTKVKVPSNEDVSHVDGASSWSFDSSSKVLTVTIIHASTQQIELYLNPITKPITDTINAIIQIQLLILVILSFALIGQIANGNASSGTTNMMIGVIVSNAVIVMLLKFIEGLLT